MRRTAYYDLAEHIANHEFIDMRSFFVCNHLPVDEKIAFCNMYEEDAVKYWRVSFRTVHQGNPMMCYPPSYYPGAWMSDPATNIFESNKHRVIALLMMHEMEVNP